MHIGGITLLYVFRTCSRAASFKGIDRAIVAVIKIII